MAGRGLLVPPWYVSQIPDATILNVCSIIWGFSLCNAVFTASKAFKQSLSAYQKGKLFTAYPIMIWSEWLASVTISVISWLFLKGTIEPSFWLYFAILCLWVVQMHCILQIIINRVTLVMVNKTHARRLKLTVFFIVVAINISVFCIWMPARLQITKTYVHINDIWDRTEKAIFAAVDASLNCYFMWTVRTSLIAGGLSKYRQLFRFNLMMVCISMALDVILIGSMSIGTGVIYIQFHPLVYLIKLHIELNMAELIAKVVRASNPLNTAGTIETICDQTNNGRDNSLVPTILSDHPLVPHRDSGIGSNREVDLAEQGRRQSGNDYHMAIRPDMHAQRSGGTILDDTDGEQSETKSMNELRKKLSAV